MRRVVILMLLCVSPASGQTSENVTRIDQIDRLRGFLGGVRQWYWPRHSAIPVCFEPDSELDDDHGKQVIIAAVENSWPKAGGITFVFGTTCLSGTGGIHIFLRDDRPHTRDLKLGTQLNGVRYGLTLNTSFQLSGDVACKKNLDDCIRATAVHEFGHVLGFVHEDILPDAKKQCLGEIKGSIPDASPVTDYDLSSIMNYCSGLYSGDKSLSTLDKEGMLEIYGPPASA